MYGYDDTTEELNNELNEHGALMGDIDDDWGTNAVDDDASVAFTEMVERASEFLGDIDPIAESFMDALIDPFSENLVNSIQVKSLQGVNEMSVGLVGPATSARPADRWAALASGVIHQAEADAVITNIVGHVYHVSAGHRLRRTAFKVWQFAFRCRPKKPMAERWAPGGLKWLRARAPL